MEFSRRLDLFGPEIFAALNDKKVALEAEGRHLYNLSVGTPDFAPADYLEAGAHRRRAGQRKLEVQPARPARDAGGCLRLLQTPL